MSQVDGHHDVDHGLGGQPGHGGRTDVLDQPGPVAEDAAESGGPGGEPGGPARVVGSRT